jgi:hypothetical protein
VVESEFFYLTDISEFSKYKFVYRMYHRLGRGICAIGNPSKYRKIKIPTYSESRKPQNLRRIKAYTGVLSINNILHIVNKVEYVCVFQYILNLMYIVKYVVFALYSSVFLSMTKFSFFDKV